VLATFLHKYYDFMKPVWPKTVAILPRLKRGCVDMRHCDKSGRFVAQVK
jgi:hypothetical protein